MAIDINSSNVDLMGKIKETSSSSVIIAALNHSNADKAVLLAASFYAQFTEDPNAVYKGIIKSNIVTSDILCDVVSKTGNGNIVIEAIKSPKSDAVLLKKATYLAKHKTFENAIYEAIIKSSVVTSDILCEVISKTKNSNVMIEAIKSPKSNMMLLEKASFFAQYTDDELAVINAINTVVSMTENLVDIQTVDSENTKDVEEVNFIK